MGRTVSAESPFSRIKRPLAFFSSGRGPLTARVCVRRKQQQQQQQQQQQRKTEKTKDSPSFAKELQMTESDYSNP